MGLVDHLLGRRIESFTVHSARAGRRCQDPTMLAEAFAGRTIEEVARRGKFLWLATEGSPLALVLHLGMSGQLLFHASVPGGLPRHTAATLVLDDGALLFVDQRTFGYVDAVPWVRTDDGNPGGLGTMRPLVPATVAHVGRDPLDPCLDLGAAAVRMHRTSSAIKRVLLDQRYVSGIGNIYADETLWHAHVNPGVPARALAARELGRIVTTAAEVMASAVTAGGTSFDALYVDTMGQSGYFSRELRVYGRTGLPCGRCGTLIERHVIGGRSAHLCPRCQTPNEDERTDGSRRGHHP